MPIVKGNHQGQQRPEEASPHAAFPAATSLVTWKEGKSTTIVDVPTPVRPEPWASQEVDMGEEG
jgi:hypothetical protein